MSGLLNAVDFFCGGGGFSHGAEMSGAVRVKLAVNHWKTAMETHKLNHPDCLHAMKDFGCVSPTEVGSVDVLLASPPCQGHSLGRGNKPTTEQARTDAWDLLRWYAEKRIPEGVIENVPRFAKWGPVDGNGYPIKSKAGQYFDAWVMAIRALGHQVEWRVLNCADFGAATSRPRLIIRTRYGKRAPLWPEPTHVGKHRPAVIDLSVTGKIIGPHLADKTLARIKHGREMFGTNPFLVEYYGSSSVVGIDRPLPTITTRDRHGLVIGDTLRMLNNQELAACQGFEPDYQFVGNRSEVTMQIGNSVSPVLAAAICRAIAG